MGKSKKNTKTWSEDEDSGDESAGKVLSHSERRCKFCTKLLRKPSDISVHESICPKAISNIEKVIISEDGRKIFLCKICLKTFKFLSGLLRHKKRHEPPGGYICRYCNERFCKETDLMKHKEDTHEVLKCKLCDTIFKNDSEFLKHIDSVHQGQDREHFVCETCGQQFRTQAMLGIHTESKCGAEKPYECSECGLRYMTKGILNSHKLIHKNEKYHCCSYCGKSFVSRGQLTVHERRHTGEKPYHCEVCSKSFSHRESLVTHASVHTGIKPYVCECCSATFSCIGNLQKHRRTRPSTCGLPQYKTNAKAAPRPSLKIPGSLRMKTLKIKKINKVVLTPENVIFPKDEQINVSNEENNSKETEEVFNDLHPKAEDQNFIKIDSLDPLLNDSPTENKFNYSVEFENAGSEITEEINETNNKTIINETKVNLELQNDIIYAIIEKVEEQSEYVEELDNKLKISDITLINDCNTETNLNSTEIQSTEYIVDEIVSENNNENFDDDILKNETKESELSRDQDEINNEGFIIYKIECQTECKNEENNEKISSENDISMEEDTTILMKKLLSDNEEDYDNDVTIGQDNNDSNDEKFSSISQESIKETMKDTKPIKMPITKRKEKKLIECSLCAKAYYQRKTFIKHLQNEHQQNLKDHEKPDDMIKCSYCDKKYKHFGSYKKHLEEHGPDRKLIYKSVCCREYFASEEEATKHTATVHYDRVTCFECQRTYSDPESLAAHKRYAHNNNNNMKEDKNDTDNKVAKKKLACKKCNRKFFAKTALTDHERSNCGKNPLYKCDDCGKHYHSAGSLKTHRTIHTGNLPHLCQYCGKAFRTEGQVTVHHRQHSGEKPYKCEMCPKSFAYRESLVTHFSIHTGKRRYECKNCGLRFSCVSNLQAHRKTNSSTCGAVPNNTKAVGDYIGVASGTIYLGQKYDDKH